MDLRERLRLMRPAGARPVDAAPTRAAPDAWRAHARRDAAARLLRAHPFPTPAGTALCVEVTFPPDHRRGAVPVGAPLRVPGKGWARLGREPAWESLDPEQVVFLDTETTSLERGTGTHVFLVGVGRFAGGRFRVRQFFLPDYDEEPALLHAVLAELEGARAVVTFNGKSFDWPLLATRLTLGRLPVPEVRHLDLLYPARRLWRDQAESCRLVDLERHALGETRHGDVPGLLIPSLYFHYLRTGEAEPLAPVLEHNRLDVLSLASLAGYLGLAAADPLRAAPAGAPLTAAELHALGRLLLDQGELAAGATCLEEALQRGLAGPARARCQRELAAAYRRAGSHADARRIWEAMIAEGARSATPYVELAKHHEHRERDLEAAREMTLRAMAVLEQLQALLGLEAVRAEMAELRHRLGRIEAKLQRTRAGRQPRWIEI